jgi:hypothetical protein
MEFVYTIFLDNSEENLLRYNFSNNGLFSCLLKSFNFVLSAGHFTSNKISLTLSATQNNRL